MLEAARSSGIPTKGNTARALADAVAEAASRGWLTTQTGPSKFGRAWLLTAAGLTTLNIEKGIT